MKTILRKAIACLPAGIADRLHAIKHRVYWLTKGGKSHHAYFDTYQTRSEVLDVLRDWLASHPLASIRVLEFGSSGGNNLLLMRETMSMPVEFVGMDIQPDAIAFAKQKFPDDTFMVGDDMSLAAQAGALGHFDVFLASGVLSYIPQPRCQAVLEQAARVADLVLVCDDLSRFDAQEGENDGLFLHPYARMCREAGLQIVVPPVASLTGHRYSTFMARSTAGKG